MLASQGRVAGSFRDPSGFVFLRESQVYRQVNRAYQENYDRLMQSGLYDALVREGWLIPHTEASLDLAESQDAYRVLKPTPVPFISYPYGWCFSQLKHAALLTLQVQRAALDFGMSLKDASAYNIQFLDGKPVLIDTLSFETYREGQPWVAYRQFCQHFLAPLALAATVDIRLMRLLRIHVDGIPLDLASRLLPLRTRASFGLLSHIHLHAGAQAHFNRKRVSRKLSMGRTALLGLLDSLQSTVTALRWQGVRTAWRDYHSMCNYSAAAFEDKKRIVAEMLEGISPTPKSAWDLGANIGVFSRLASRRGIFTVAFDVDPGAVETNYLQCRAEGETHLLPLWLDLTNPSPSLGWESRERLSLLERGPADVVLALALIHHLVISNNLSLAQVASFLSRVGRSAIVEFVPKSDSQAQILLATREDIFPDYNQESFEREFSRRFIIRDTRPIQDTGRILYAMTRRNE